MNFSLQKKTLKRMMKKKGVSSDLYDLNARIDKTLNLDENITEINKRSNFKLGIKNRSANISSAALMLKAQEINDKRSNKAQYMDQKKGAVNTFDGDTLTSKQFKKWKKKPSRFDIYGVDRF